MRSKFLRIGHRGAAAYTTENTLSSIQAALECQVDMVEMDVRLTKDQHLVLNHDPFLHGQDRKVKIKKYSLDQLQHVCLPNGEIIATLEQALQFVKGRALVNIDLKEKGCEEAVVRLVEKLKMEREVMFSGTIVKSLQQVKRLNPKLYTTLTYPSAFVIDLYYIRPVQFILQRLNQKWAMLPVQFLLRRLMPIRVKRMTLDRGFDALMIRLPLVSAKLVDVVHSKELKLYTFPADHAHEVAKMQDWGVDGITSNRPDILHTSDTHLAHRP